MNRGAWWAAVHGVAKRGTTLSDFHFYLTGLRTQKSGSLVLSQLGWEGTLGSDQGPSVVISQALCTAWGCISQGEMLPSPNRPLQRACCS